MKIWSQCPYDKQKLAMIDDTESIKGVFIKCKTCKREIEIKNNPRARDQSQESLRPETRVMSHLVHTG